MKLTLVRHTSLAIAADICYGQSDVDVSENFNKECLSLQHKLTKFEFDAVYTSPLKRCHLLAQALCSGDGLLQFKDKITLDARLKELHFGDWEMRAWDSIAREDVEVWAKDYAHLAPPHGETFTQLHLRANSFVTEKMQQSQHEHLLLVTHGGLIRALIAEVLELPLKRLFRLKIDHASVTQIEFNGEVPKLLFMNL